MPFDAPKLKVAAAKGYGANVIQFEGFKKCEEMAHKFEKEKGMTFIPPYNHPDVVAGQGTSAKELFEEVGELDYLFVCVGGGGITSGCSIASKALSPRCKVYGVEPEAGNDA